MKRLLGFATENLTEVTLERSKSIADMYALSPFVWKEKGRYSMIIPPKPEGDATDIAFAALCIGDHDRVNLYYSVADKDMLCAALAPIFA